MGAVRSGSGWSEYHYLGKLCPSRPSGGSGGAEYRPRERLRQSPHGLHPEGRERSDGGSGQADQGGDTVRRGGHSNWTLLSSPGRLAHPARQGGR
ncbi:hypothetical protein PoB_007227200, partial [Plakobranchus ocellatus]